MVKTVLFDLDDTLLWDDRSVDESFAATCAYAHLATGVEPSALEEAVKKCARELYATYDTFPLTQQIGINPFEGLWGKFHGNADKRFDALAAIAPTYRAAAWTKALQSLNVDDPTLGAELADRFGVERRSRAYVYPETFAVLDVLKGKFKLGLLTNGAPDLQQEKLSMTPKLVPYFDRIVISGDFGQGKPAVELFRHALSGLETAPQDAVMVGDKLTTDILGANRAGIRGVWINRHARPNTGEGKPDHEIRSLTELLPILQS